MKSLVVIIVLCATMAEARADRSWWQQFYGRVGYRSNAGADNADSPTLAVGYRVERTRWAVDIAAFDVQQGLDVGVHELAKISLVRKAPVRGGNAWLAIGAGYSIAAAWAESDVPRRRGHGPQLDAAIGYDFEMTTSIRAFTQIGVGVPLYQLRDRYDSMESSMRLVPVDVALGVRL